MPLPVIVLVLEIVGEPPVLEVSPDIVLEFVTDVEAAVTDTDEPVLVNIAPEDDVWLAGLLDDVTTMMAATKYC